LEVDFIVPGRAGALRLIECKASGTTTPAMAAPLLRLAKAFEARKRHAIEPLIVHEAPSGGGVGSPAPSVRAVDWREYFA